MRPVSCSEGRPVGGQRFINITWTADHEGGGYLYGQRGPIGRPHFLLRFCADFAGLCLILQKPGQSSSSHRLTVRESTSA
jgi:hypothetical protein